MASDLRVYLDTVLSRIAQDDFGRREAPQIRLADGVTEDSDGGLSGKLLVTIRTRNGAEPEIQNQTFEGLRTREQIDDLFGHALSVLLMNHMDWPR